MTTTTITWIPTAERLPDDHSTVLLALDDGHVFTGWHEGAFDPTPARWVDVSGWHEGAFDPTPARWMDVSGWQVDQPVTHWADLPAAPQEAEAQPAQAAPVAWMCPAHCGCLWRDNGDGSMSLFGPNSKSCPFCEPPPLNRLVPVFAQPAAPAVPEGWKLVPAKPTEDMLFAAGMSKSRGYSPLYAAMLAAAPKLKP